MYSGGEMLEIKDKKNCCGCAACAQICPKRCISMEADQEGFYYPIVEKRNCINCGRCKAVCPFLKKGECLEVLNAYGGYSKDAEVRETSSSGGIFSLLASYMILSGGVVFGISMSDDCKSAYYREVQDIKDLKYLQGSGQNLLYPSPRKHPVSMFYQKSSFYWNSMPDKWIKTLFGKSV